MNNTVNLYHNGLWYKCYDDDADVISILTGYKVFISPSGKQSLGFPDSAIDKVISKLRINCVNFESDIASEDYGDNNKYIEVLERYSHKPKIKGSFTVKYEGINEIESFTIGDNISEDAELTKHVASANVGDILVFNGNRVFVIDKQIQPNN